MNFNEIDYNNIDEDELYKMIFKECNINDFFINQSTTAYSELKEELAYMMLQNGISKIMSENDVNKMLQNIEKDWIIEENSVTFAPLDLQRNNSDLYARDIKYYSTKQIKKVDDNTVQNSQFWYLVESNFAEEAQSLGFEDMPIILENDNRIDEYIVDERYRTNPNGEDSLDSKIYKRKVSSLDKEKFSELQKNLSPRTIQRLINLPDDYFQNITKTSYNNNLTLSDLVPNNIEMAEKKQYTEEQFSKMAENIINKTEMGNREQIIEQALRELGVSEKLLSLPKEQKIYDIAETAISNNDQIGDLTSKDQIEQLLKQLNNDLIIKEDYLAGKVIAPEDVMNETAQTYGIKRDEVIRNDAIEVYVDKNGIYHSNQTASLYLENVDKNVRTAVREKDLIRSDNGMELLTQRDKWSNGKTNLDEYTQSALKDMNINTALAMINKPNTMWASIFTEIMRPDIIISRMMPSRERTNRENQLQSSSIISGNNERVQQGPGYSNYENEVTEQDIKEAERVIATRSNAAKSGAVSQVVENSEKVLEGVSEYIEGDAESQAAKAANEEERSHKQRTEQEENITK